MPDQKENYAKSLRTLARAISGKKLFECARCNRKYNVANASENGTYKCASCNVVMNAVSEQVASTIRAEDAELILDESIPREVIDAIGRGEIVGGRYVIVEGTKGYDIELLRFVEVRQGEFKTDARTLSALEHKNIARIYDVGAGYVVSEYTTGRGTATVPLQTLPDICEAVEYAHSKGVCHGNLIPENIIIDSNGNAMITGFGKGGDRESDLRALQAMICRESTELAAIAAHKYSSAAEIARDIRNYLGGYSVSAFGSSPTYRFKKAVKRNRLAIVIASVACVILATVAIFAYLKDDETGKDEEWRMKNEAAIRGQKLEKEQAAEKERMQREERERLVNALLKDLASAYDEAIQRRRAGEGFRSLAAIPDRIMNSPLFSQVHDEANRDFRFKYSLGKLYRIVSRLNMAQKEQQAALAMSPENGSCLYELAMIAYRAYYDHMTQLGNQSKIVDEVRTDVDSAGGFKDQKTAELNRVAADLASRARARLEADSSMGIITSALQDFLEHKYDAALEKIKCALQKDPANDDAVRFSVSAFVMKQKYEDAVRVLSDALETDKGNGDLYLNRAADYCRIAEKLPEGNRAERADVYRKAIADYSKVLELLPSSGLALTWRADAWINLGAQLETAERTDAFRNAISDYAAAISAEPQAANLLARRGRAYFNMATVLVAAKEDPLEYIDKGIADLNASLAKERERSEPWSSRGILLKLKAEYEKRNRVDPCDSYKSAVSDLKQAAQFSPESPQVFLSLAEVLYSYGKHIGDHGMDSMGVLSEASAAASKGLEIKRGSFALLDCRGRINYTLTVMRMESGLDPAGCINMAIADLGSALAIKPDSCATHISRGTLLTNKGLFFRKQGIDPSSDYQQAMRDLDKAIELNPRESTAWSARANLWMDLGSFRASQKNDPGPEFARALEDIEASLKIDPDSADCWFIKGRIHENLVQYSLSKKKDPSEQFQSSAECLEKAMHLNPFESGMRQIAGRLYSNWGCFKYASGKDPSNECKKSTDLLQGSGGSVPGKAEPLKYYAEALGAWYLAMFRGSGRSDLSAEELKQKMFAAFESAIRLNPKDGELLKRRGIIHYRIGNLEDALRDLESARVISPALAQSINPVIEEIRKKSAPPDY